MPKFRKKPVVVEAMQWTGENDAEVLAWIDNDADAWVNRGDFVIPILSIRTPEGTMQATPGDWITRGVKGEFYPCKPDIFTITYEEVQDA